MPNKRLLIVLIHIGLMAWPSALFAMELEIIGMSCVNPKGFSVLKRKNFYPEDNLKLRFDSKNNTIVESLYEAPGQPNLMKTWRLNGETCQEFPEMLYFWLERESQAIHQMKLLKAKNAEGRFLEGGSLRGERRSRLGKSLSLGVGGLLDGSFERYGLTVPIVFESNVRNRVGLRAGLRWRGLEVLDLDEGRVELNAIEPRIGMNIFLSDRYAERNTRKGLGLHLMLGVNLETHTVDSTRPTSAMFQSFFINPAVELGLDYRLGELPFSMSLIYHRSFIQTRFVTPTVEAVATPARVLFEVRYHFLWGINQ